GFALLFAVGISAVIGSGVSSADTIIGVFSSTGLALGVVLLSASGGFSKYSSYLIGDILTVQPEEIALLGCVLLAVLLVWGLFFNRFLLSSINGDLAASKNIREGALQKIFVILVAVLVTVSIKWVGVLIINSLLVLPAASARNVARSMRSYHAWSVGVSMFSGVTGLILSYYLGTAAGGTIVLVAAVVFAVTFLAGMVSGRRAA
ncbi:MAG TPA: metal ABC transporter permease, partial [Candidatus Caccousia stercoris]|nr:metal ABC transporter permease [Candidatus Caccousia stercoris]